MNHSFKIVNIKGREILDSRGNPTVEAEVFLEGGAAARASVPSGASTGMYEAFEKRDGDLNRYGGKGVLRAVGAIDGEIREKLLKTDVRDQAGVDLSLCAIDGTKNKERLGANAILAVSLACAKAGAKQAGTPLYKYLGGVGKVNMPIPMMNVINGGVHAGNGLDTQEFMIMPVGEARFHNRLKMCAEVYRSLKKTINCGGVGDEGGFAPNFFSDEEALDALMEAIKNAGYKPGKDFMIALDAAASEWKSGKKGEYILPKKGTKYTGKELIEHWKHLAETYPIISIEDALDEEDWEGWKSLTKQLGHKVQLVGDDLFVTNTRRLEKGIRENCGNSILIKLNQIGSVSETLEAIKMAHRAGYTAISSHRSGETENTFIADLAVALNMGQIKTGAPSRSERVAKYNRLLRIEENLGDSAVYAAEEIFWGRKRGGTDSGKINQF